MRENFLYKCTDCHTVVSEVNDYGEVTWSLICRACGNIVTEHYKLNVIITSEILKSFYICSVICPKEKEDDNGMDSK